MSRILDDGGVPVKGECGRVGGTHSHATDRAATVAEYVIGQVRAIIAVYDAGGTDADSVLDRIERVIGGV